MRTGRLRAGLSPRKWAAADCGGTYRSTCRPRTKRRLSIFGTYSFCTDFRNHGKTHAAETLVDLTLEPRLNQIFAPLISIISDPNIRRELWEVARERQQEIVADRSMDVEAQLLEVIRDLERQQSKLAIGEITAAFIHRFGKECERRVTSKWIGFIVRRRLNILKTHKNNGVYVISFTEQEKLRRLYEKYGLTDQPSTGANLVDIREKGDFNADVAV